MIFGWGFFGGASTTSDACGEMLNGWCVMIMGGVECEVR